MNASFLGDIVVVDDTVASLKLLTEILTRAGYHVRPASDGVLALRSIHAKSPSLILLDIRMPDMDGFEVCRQLKDCPQTCDIPVIFLSSLTDMEDRTHGFELGAADYIAKPFYAQDVLMRVKVHNNLFLTQKQLKAEISARQQAETLLRVQQDNLEELVKQRSNELNKMYARYQAIFLEARDGIVLIDVNTGKIVDCNPEFERQCGRSLTELQLLFIWQTQPEAQKEFSKQLFYQIVTEQNIINSEIMIQQPDNSCIPVEFIAKYIVLDNQPYIQSMVRDISERKRIDTERQISEKRYQQLFDTMQEGCYLAELIFDETGKAIDWVYLESNPVHAKCLKLSREQVIGKRLKEVFPEIDAFWIDIPVQTALTGQPSEIEAFGRITGHYYDCHYYSPNYGQFACIFNDITERKQAEIERDKVQRQLYETLENVIQALTIALEMRDPYTAGHQKRVAKLAVSIAREMGLPETRIQGIFFGGLLHDIGKIAIPAEILNKPGRLSELEYLLIKQHPQTGYDIIKEINFPWPVAQMILQHHEHIDGSGYPHGLKNEDIILEARILTVADVVEAMYSHRPYRPGLGVHKAVAEIQRGCNTCYDADVVDACLELFNKEGEFLLTEQVDYSHNIIKWSEHERY